MAEHWWVYNRTNKPISIGDLPQAPGIWPGRKEDLLRYHAKQDIGNSENLVTLIRMGYLRLQKERMSEEAARKVESTERDELFDTLQGLDEDPVIVWDDMRIPVTATVSGSSNPPAFKRFIRDEDATISKAISLDGSHYVNIADSTDSPLDVTTSLTVVMVVKPTDLSSAKGLFNKDSAYKATLNNGRLQFTLNATTTQVDQADSISDTTKWYQFAFVYSQDDSAVRIYIDGDLKKVATFSDAIATNNNALTIGYNGSAYFVGLIDETWFFNRALSSTEISQLYNDGAFEYEPPANNIAVYHFEENLEDSSTSELDGTYAPGDTASYVEGVVTRVGSHGVFTYHFSPDASQELYFTAQLPHGWKEGSIIRPHVHWCPTTTDSGNVGWGLEYAWANVNEVYQDTTTLTTTVESGETAYKHSIASFGELQVTTRRISSMFVCRLYRDVTVDSNYNADAALLEIDFHIQMDALGSSAQFTK